MSSVNIEVSVGSNKFGFEWDVPNLYGADYDDLAPAPLRKLDEGYARVRAAIVAGLSPENSVVDDRPVAESRTVQSGPVSIRPVRGAQVNVNPNSGPDN